MTHTKTVIVNTDWLNALDGLTVAKAIEYLSKLDQSYVLNCWMDGDTHGVDLNSNLTYGVPMTNEEILEAYRKHYNKEITMCRMTKEQHEQARRELGFPPKQR